MVTMNTGRKIYCRTFQMAFKLALPFLPYRQPEIVKSVKLLPEIIRKKKCDSVLIITDAGVYGLGLTARLESALRENGISYVIYDKTVANPTTDNVAEALDMYYEYDCNAIIGFGGGSSMDCAKAVEAYGESIHKKLHRLAITAKIADKDTPADEVAELFIDAIKDMKERFDIGDTIPEIKEEDIPKLAHYADKEANPLYPVPVLMDAKELEKFYFQLKM